MSSVAGHIARGRRRGRPPGSRSAGRPSSTHAPPPGKRRRTSPAPELSSSDSDKDSSTSPTPRSSGSTAVTRGGRGRGRGPGRPPRRPVIGRDQNPTTPTSAPIPPAPIVSPMLFVARARLGGGGGGALDSRELVEYLRSFVTLPDDTVLSSLPQSRPATAAERKPGAMTKPEQTKSKRDLLAEKREREATMRDKFAEWVSSMAHTMFRVSELRRLGMLRDSGDPQSAQSFGDDDGRSPAPFSYSSSAQVPDLLKMPPLLPPALPEPAPKAREPPRPKSTWDQLLVDIADRHKEMTVASRRRRALLRKCSRQIEREDEEKKARLGIFKRPEMAERAERENQRRLAKWTAQQVLKKWAYVESIMDEQRQIEEDEMKSKEDKRVLFDMLHRSTQLLEGQRMERRSSSASSSSSEAHVPVSGSDDDDNLGPHEPQRRQSGRKVARIDGHRDSAMSMESMRESLPSSDDEDAAISPEQSDIEFTSESSANGDSDDEMNDLTLDQDVPVESLLGQYFEMQRQQQSSQVSSDSESDGAMSEDVDISDAESDSNLGIEELAAKTPEHAVEQPFLLRGDLREYQRQGLDWLASLHQHQINGILADEMGLGKTIQTIALLAHLACHRGIWGPHLVIVPTSVLLNWEQEFHRWLPGFKVLTYYGSRAERKQKRKGWSKPNALHVCVTSYQLAIQDATVFRRKPWYYMILDEAQAIKNFRSQRWQTLLGVKSACRLLLTGTPLQNSLIELWSLMYFLMPQEFSAGDGDENEALGFAGLDRFREWFSQPLEKLLAVRPEIAAPVGRGASEKVAFNTTSFLQGSGEAESSMALSTQVEAQQAVQKLHTVLRPHILRRLKQDVETQLPDKTEHVVYCHLSKRQRLLYDDFMSRSQTRETLQAGTYLGVMGCLMQLRKVCNHPDLFETRPIVTSWAMSGAPVASYRRTEDLVRRMLAGGRRAHSGQSPMPWEGCAGETAWRLRGLIITSGELQSDAAAWDSARRLDASPALLIRGLERARDALDPILSGDADWDELKLRPYASRYRTVRGYTDLQYHVSDVRSGDAWMRLAAQNACRIQGLAFKPVYGSGLLQAVSVTRGVRERLGEAAAGLVLSGRERLELYQDTIGNYVFATPAVLVANTASDRESVLPYLRTDGAGDVMLKELVPNILHLRRRVARHTLPIRPLEQRLQIAFPEPFLLQYDCGKLQALDRLLGRLVREGHRALVFTQMTKVLDILEKWLNLHGYRYLRLDGATKVEQRWRLTERFNHDPKWTVFISSTRAGGLGINLTGADTVIFYDSDWNHAMDAQCQDRCHRIGQQREVHIYRLISDRTIEEAIWKKQCQKRWLNQVVIQEGRFDPNATRESGRPDSTDDMPPSDSGAAAAAALGVGDWYELASAVLTQSASASHPAAELSRPQAISEREAARMLGAAEDEVDAMALKVAIAEVAQADALDLGDEPGSKATELAVDAREGSGAANVDGKEDAVQEPDEYNDDGISHIDDYMFRFLSEDYF
ncbi:swr1 complex component [Coemansia sp. RSA 922]|nr:swr1 complex component [Coemansia sp. RSA 922]